MELDENTKAFLQGVSGTEPEEPGEAALEVPTSTDPDKSSNKVLQAYLSNKKTPGVLEQSREFEMITTTPDSRAPGPTRIVSKHPDVMEIAYTRFLGTDVDDPVELERLGAITLGSLAGGKAGASAGSVAGPLGTAAGAGIGAVAGAAAGAAFPEEVVEVMEALGLLPEGTREERYLTDEELRRVVAGEALIEFLTGGTLTAARVGSRVSGRVLSGVGKEEVQFATRASDIGVDLPAYALKEGGVGYGIVNVLGRFPLLGSKARNATRRAEQAMLDLTKEYPERLAPILAESEISTRIYRDAKNYLTEVSDGFSRRYDQLATDAAAMGAYIRPDTVRTAGEKVLGAISRESPTIVDDAGNYVQAPMKLLEPTIKFIQDEITRLADAQSFTQMDTLLAKIDEHIADAPPEVRKYVARALGPLKGAVKTDLADNIYPRGPKSRMLTRRMAKLDAEFSEAMLTIFETATANKIGLVRKGGIRGVVAPSEEATRRAVDTLYPTIADMRSPQAMAELRRIVSPETYKAIAARTLSDAFEHGIKETSKKAVEIHPEAFADFLGMSARGKPTARGKAVEELFKGTGITPQSLDTMRKVMHALSAHPIPNVSTFIARRAVLSGGRGIHRSFYPFVARAGGILGLMTATVHTLTMLGGSRALVGVVTDPKMARPLSKVMNEELGTLARYNAGIELLRGSIYAMSDEEIMDRAEVPRNMVDETRDKLFAFGQDLMRQYKDTEKEKAP